MLWFLAALILGLSFYRLYMYVRKVKNYYKVAATIVGNDIKTVEDPLMGPKYFYAPIVEFTDKSGELKQMICGEDNPGRPIYKDGAKLTLLVHPDDASRFLVHDFVNGYLIPVIWIIIGVSIVLIPYIFPETFK
ncbi:hypothetical protein EXU57_22570 [Segetibacter sp. 3557_3]|uniref:DUF3592 domain-containing protein n=1 Tax=Segetibacter sp. 3557_3 TaxID=2547429 RepID=UPI001058E02D|nr:DUF3592 domain-containing protein [Segetibacter sp. 3557_3]TDH19839.1 hypothetical protein EXU57_22570 [Segetibacter sp. 3557_3]